MIYLELFYTFFLIGLFTFGGGYAMIPMIKEQVVSRGFISESALADFIAISEATPGPFAINISTFVGAEVGGVLGALMSTFGVILPSLIIIIIIAMIMVKFMKNRFVKGYRCTLCGKFFSLEEAHLTCPICGEQYAEPLAISRTDNKTEICSSCGIRQAVSGLLSEADIEAIIQKNKELYKQVNGS